MASSQLELITKLPAWHAATQPFYPPLVFKIPESLLAAYPRTGKQTIEGLIQVDRIGDISVDPELYSSISVPGAEWEARRTKMVGSGDNGFYYFVFAPPFTSRKLTFELSANRRTTFRLRCDIFLVPDGVKGAAEARCMRYVKKTLLDQCWLEITIVPLNPFYKMRQWDDEIQQKAEELAEEVRSQTGINLKVSTRNWDVRRTPSRELLWQRYHQRSDPSRNRQWRGA